ncbi:MAG: hypothetical protein P4L99_28090 [Chthoniobacter sp.]|nr:hypothetical protein [Chthoniobacter sp.]
MNAHDAARAIARVIALRPGLTDCHVYAHDLEVKPTGEEYTAGAEEIQLPAVFVRVKCESLTGSSTLGRARIEIDVESQVDDSTAAQHGARESEVRAAMADQDALLAAFGVIGTVALKGRISLGENDPETEHRAFKTPLTYKAGIEAL